MSALGPPSPFAKLRVRANQTRVLGAEARG
jgi:hypothetical protein